MEEELFKRIGLELKTLAHEHHVDPNLFNQLMIDDKVIGEFASTMAVRVMLTLLGRVVATDQDEKQFVNKTEEVGYYQRPCTWWDGLKFTLFTSKWIGWVFPDWAVSDWVKYETLTKNHTFVTNEKRTIRYYHVCPLPAWIADQSNVINFLTGWKEPFTGSQREYMMLSIIVRQLLTLCQDPAFIEKLPPDLMKAVSEYITEVTRLAEMRSRIS